jgi:hypothetical protein
MLVLSLETLPWWFVYDTVSYLDLLTATQRRRGTRRKQLLDESISVD